MLIKLNVILVFLLLCTGCGSDSSSQEDGDGTLSDPNNAELWTLIDDMAMPHEAQPGGVPDIGWDKGPRIGYGNTPPKDWNAMIPWGQVYTDESGNNAENVRFQIRNLQTWYLSKSEGKWVKWVSSSNIDGANYAEDFQNDVNIPADIRSETGNEGGVSATLVSGYNFHYWTAEGRVTIDSDDIDAVWSAVDARLILDNPSGVDEIEKTRLMMSVGADYWLNLTTKWDQWKTNGDIFIGRFRYMNSQWQRFHAHTLTEEQIEKGPLPPYNIN